MRGKVVRVSSVRNTLRITPAYAGKSRALYAEAKNYEDHPRLCGEKRFNLVVVAVVIGSPPPMRGKAIKFSSSEM